MATVLLVCVAFERFWNGNIEAGYAPCAMSFARFASFALRLCGEQIIVCVCLRESAVKKGIFGVSGIANLAQFDNSNYMYDICMTKV